MVSNDDPSICEKIRRTNRIVSVTIVCRFVDESKADAPFKPMPFKPMQIQSHPFLRMKNMPLFFCVLVAAIGVQLSAQSSKQHPWLSGAPGEFVRLIDRGNVNILVDDDRVRKAGKTALTVFQFSVDYDFKFRHQLIGYDDEAQTWQAKIVAWMDQPKVKLDHKVFFQSTFTPLLPWESKLLRHEFDHVAISTDPRLIKIIKRSLQQRRQWIAKWKQATAPTEPEIRQNILETFTAEVRSLEQLVQTQYDYLDSESNQGISAIHSRSEFFKGLYSIQGLDRCSYALDDVMRQYVKDKLSIESIQKEVEGHYLFLNP